MKKFIKASLVAGVAGVVSLSAAAPAHAQYYPYPQSRSGIDVGQIVRGIGTAVAVGAIANAVRGRGYSNGGYGGYGVYGNGGYGNGGYGNYGYGNQGYGYGNPGYGYQNRNIEGYAVEACASQASRYGRVAISDVERRSSRTLRVRGVIDAAGYNNRGYGYGDYGDYERRSFSCSVRTDGRITDFNLGRSRY